MDPIDLITEEHTDGLTTNPYNVIELASVIRYQGRRQREANRGTCLGKDKILNSRTSIGSLL